jgi:hypothetical protein
MKETNDFEQFYEVEQQTADSISWLDIVERGSSKYSFGFWNFKIQIRPTGDQILTIESVSKNGLFTELAKAGFCKRYRQNGTYILIRVEDNILKLVTPAQIKDFALALVDSLPESVMLFGFKILKAQLKETFLREQHCLFGENVLSPLPTHTADLLSDTPREMFFPFQNAVIQVDASGLKMIPYADLKNVCIWENHILTRDFQKTVNSSMFCDFINNVCSNDAERIKAMRAAIGYLLHRFYNQTTTKAVILYDEQLTGADSANGGTGKGLFANAVGYMREMLTIDGKKFEKDDKFSLQSITEATEIVLFDDVRKDFEFERFNSILTNGWEIEAKHVGTIRIPLKQSPKMVVASNSILKTLDGNTVERRQFILEFSDFYSRMKNETLKPVVDVHGCEFFYDWNVNQWLEFDNYMIESCRIYLQDGLPMVKAKNVEINRLLQATTSDFVEWTTEMQFSNETNYPFNEYFQNFKELHYGSDSQFSSKTFSIWMKQFAKCYGFEHKSLRYNALTYFKFIQK